MTDFKAAVDEIMSTINAEIALGNLPSMSDMVSETIRKYAEFTNAVLDSASISEVDTAVQEFPEGALFNEKVQFYVALEARGIVTLNPGPNAAEHIYNPMVKSLGADGVRRQFDSQVVVFEDFEDALVKVVAGIAVNHLLQPSPFLDLDILSPSKYPLVHHQTSTIH